MDADVEIAGVSAKGKLLTLTTTEALAHKVAEFTADTLEGALDAAGLPDAEVRPATQTWAETLVRFLTNPIVSSLLMTIGMLGILVEIRTPGFAVPGTIGLLSLGLFFWGQWLVQLAGWEELLLVAAGVLLVGLEVFVIPGFGVAGIAGIVALVAGLGTGAGRRGRHRGGDHRSARPRGDFHVCSRSRADSRCSGCCPTCRSAGASCSTRRCGRSRGTRRRHTPIACRSAASGPRCHRSGRRAWRRSTGRASMSSRTAASSTQAPPLKSYGWRATGSSFAGRGTPSEDGVGHT